MEKMELLERFSKLPTGNICDAIYDLGMVCHTVDGIPPLRIGQRRTAGYAVTIQQAMRKEPYSPGSMIRHPKYIDSELEEGDLLVIDVGGKMNVCSGGSFLAEKAMKKKAAGFLVNGCLRDIEELYELDFPIHLLGGNPVKSAALIETVGINVPVEINGTQIKPGDIIVMDSTGIVVISPKDAERVLEEAEKIFVLETKVAQLVEDGEDVTKAFKEASK